MGYAGNVLVIQLIFTMGRTVRSLETLREFMYTLLVGKTQIWTRSENVNIMNFNTFALYFTTTRTFVFCFPSSLQKLFKRISYRLASGHKVCNQVIQKKKKTILNKYLFKSSSQPHLFIMLVKDFITDCTNRIHS